MEIFDGRYEKLIHLGSGAFSEVWKVRDIETDIVEALKIYTSRAGIDNDCVKLFTHEFSLLANANHPNLVRPLHFAISKPEGYPYLRMKYCNNGSMKGYIGRLTEEETWRLIRDISSALTYLHKMDPPVIHQDIKPENILKDDDKYLLSDFGVSTRVKSRLSGFSVMTDTLKKAGSPDYMAPERFSDNKTPVMASDIWSLGATIYEILMMELPFTMGGLLQSKGEKVPQLRGDFSPELKQVVEDCMFLETWKRPRAEQLYEVATKMVDNLPLTGPMPWTIVEDDTIIPPRPLSPPYPLPSDNIKQEDTKEETKAPLDNTWPEPPTPTRVPESLNMVGLSIIAIVGLIIGGLLALI